MRKVLVDPAALEEAAKWLEVHSSSSGSAEAFAADALREAIGQPAEAEGVEVVAYGMPNSAPGKAPRMMMVAIDIPGDDQYGGQLWEPLVRQSALSAVTAERDRLLQEKGDPAGSFEKCMQAMRDRDEHARTIDRLRAEVERLRRQLQTAHSFIESTEAFGSAAASGILECAGAVWNIDESKALIAAMAAKEA